MLESVSRRNHHPSGLAKNALIGILAGTGIVVFAGIFTWVLSSPSFTPTDQLNVGLRQILQGEHEVAAGIAKSIPYEDLEEDSDRARHRMITGYEAWRKASESLEHRVIYDQSHAAVTQLKEARDLGFPNGYEGLGQFVLGMALSSIKELDQAVESLDEAARRYPIERSTALFTSISMLLEMTPPKTEEAIQHLREWRQLPALGTIDLEWSNLAEGMIEQKLNRPTASIAILNTIPETSPAYAEAQILMADQERTQSLTSSDEARWQLLESALKRLQAINEFPRSVPRARRESLYLTATILRELGRLDESLSVFARIRLGFPETPESLAAGISEIELSIETGRTKEIPATAAYFTTHMGKPEWYVSARFQPEQFRNRFVNAGREMLNRHLYAEAVAYGHVLPPICTDADRSRLLAEAHLRQAQAIALDNDAAEESVGVFRPILVGASFEQARPHFLQAAENFERLAKEEIRSPEFTEILWRAIEAYHAARNLDDCNRLLESYVTFENRARRPRAMLAKGENFMAVGKVDEALSTFRRLVDFYPQNPLAYRARLFSAQALIDRMDFDGAGEMLMANLFDGRLTPESPLWRESLFELGSLQYRRGDILQLEAKKLADSGGAIGEELEKLEESFQQFQVGIRRLEEALERFSEDPRCLQTRYQVAQAYRMAAQYPDRELKSGRILVEDKRKQKVQQRRELLTNAKNAYGEIRKQINASEEALELSESKLNLLRNAYFGEADLLYELGDYSTALTAYRNAANRYLNEPEALEAMMQIRECFLRLGDDREAKQTIERAKQTLKRIPAEKDSKFIGVTRYDRAQWEKVLEQSF